MSSESGSQARRRAEMILKVRSGQLTASEAAKQLGVSRKTYYEWEKRALEGMLESLENRKSGRPPNPEPDQEKERLEKTVADLEHRLEMMSEIYELRQMLTDLRGEDSSPPAPSGKTKKKPKTPRKRGAKKKR